MISQLVKMIFLAFNFKFMNIELAALNLFFRYGTNGFYCVKIYFLVFKAIMHKSSFFRAYFCSIG